LIAEEAIILGGNRQLPLGTTPTPTVTASTTGGSLAAATYSVICVALTLDGLINGSVAGGIQGQITRTNADASTDTFGGGAAKPSANQTAAVSSGLDGQPRRLGDGGEGRLCLCLVLGHSGVRSARRDHAVAGVVANQLQLERRQQPRHHRNGVGDADCGVAWQRRQFGQ